MEEWEGLLIHEKIMLALERGVRGDEGVSERTFRREVEGGCASTAGKKIPKVGGSAGGRLTRKTPCGGGGHYHGRAETIGERGRVPSRKSPP